MSEPLFNEPDPEITRDLAVKLGEDVTNAIMRTLEISPPDKFPIIIAAGLAAVYCMARYMQQRVGIDDNQEPLERSIFASALVLARVSKHKNFVVAMEEAFKDCEILEKRKRIS